MSKRRAENVFDLNPGESTGQPVVHRRHDGVVEHVGIEVNPEIACALSRSAFERVSRRCRHTTGRTSSKPMDFIFSGSGGLPYD
jgi:hypothetical protein